MKANQLLKGKSAFGYNAGQVVAYENAFKGIVEIHALLKKKIERLEESGIDKESKELRAILGNWELPGG